MYKIGQRANIHSSALQVWRRPVRFCESRARFRCRAKVSDTPNQLAEPRPEQLRSQSGVRSAPTVETLNVGIAVYSGTTVCLSSTLESTGVFAGSVNKSITLATIKTEPQKISNPSFPSSHQYPRT